MKDALPKSEILIKKISVLMPVGFLNEMKQAILLMPGGVGKKEAIIGLSWIYRISRFLHIEQIRYARQEIDFEWFPPYEN